MKLEHFVDIKIVDLDEILTEQRDHNSPMYDIHFKLSSRPENEWIELFDVERNIVRSTTQRRATVTMYGGGTILVSAPLSEAQRILNDLKPVVNTTNEKYRQYLERVQAEEKKQKDREDAERKRIDDVKKSLKFD